MWEKYTAIVVIVALVSCLAPSSRRIHTFTRPDGKKVVVVEPPPDVMTSENKAEVKAVLPRVEEILQLQSSVEQKYTRIREEVPNLQAIEVLHYLLSIDYANGAIDSVSYKEFIKEIFPLLKKPSDKERELKGPDIIIKPHGLTFIKDNKDIWQVTLYIHISNSGSTASIVEYKSLSLQFPNVRPIVFSIGRSLSIGTTAIDDTLVVKFQHLFTEEYTLENFPMFSKGILDVRSPRGELLAEVVFDSTDVEHLFSLESGDMRDLDETVDTSRDTKGKQPKLFPISYKGKIYNNYIYPPEAEVQYQIVNDRIRVEISQQFNLSSSTSNNLIPAQLLVDSEIADRVDYPKYWTMTIFREIRSKDSIRHESFKLLIGNEDEFKQQFIYIFK